MGSSVSLGRAVVTGGCLMLHESETAEMRPPPKQGRRGIALLNGGPGRACQRGAGGMRAALEPAFERLNILAELSFCSGSELKQLAEFALARAKAGEIDAVVVGGGDGSIRTVASVLADTGIPLGI